MSANVQTVRSSLTVPSQRAPLGDVARVATLVQASVRTEIDDEGNPCAVRIEVSRDEFMAYLAADGSPFCDLVPATKEPHRAMRAAITRSRKGQAETRNGDEVLDGRMRWARLGIASGGRLRYALTMEHPDPETGTLNPHRVAVVTCEATGGTDVEWVDGGTWRCGDTERAVDAVLARYSRERVLLHSDDVRAFVNRVLGACRAVGCGGMLHLVPAREEHRSGLHATGHVLDVAFASVERALIAAGYQVVIQPLGDASHLQTNVEQGLLAQVARVRREIEGLAAELASDEGRAVELETFDRRISHIAELSARADLFNDLIGMAAEDVQSALADARRMAREAQMAMLQI
jgi:hypothetical protein